MYALKNIKYFAPLINELKLLAIVSEHFGGPLIKERINGIKQRMRKKLALADIDLILAKAETNTRNHFHMIDVLSDVVMQDLPDQTLVQLADVMLTEDVEARRQKVASYSQQRETFQQGLSLLGKSAVAQQSGVELEEQVAIMVQMVDCLQSDMKSSIISSLKMSKKLGAYQHGEKKKFGYFVVLLTGTELFTENLSRAWESLGEPYSEFSDRIRNFRSLSEITKKLYLGLDSPYI